MPNRKSVSCCLSSAFWTGIFLGLTLLTPVSAQVTGRLSGTIQDPTGRGIPGARVSVTFPDSGMEEASTVTGMDGSFFFPVLRPIFYDMTVEAPNFKMQILRNVKIDPTTETSLPPVKLELGDVRTSVEATVPTQTLQTSNAEVASTLTADQVSNLPLPERDPLAPLGLLDTLPGVENNGRAPTTIDGQSVSFANVTYDGINIQDNFIRNASLNDTDVFLNLHTDQISEATIVTSNPGTIYSGGSSQVAFSTPSGGNAFHGSLYWLNIPGGIGAQYFVANAYSAPNSTQLNQVGATLGGPLLKNKLFFFLNFESDQNGSTDTQLAVVPSAPVSSTYPSLQHILNLYPSPNGYVGLGPFAGFNYSGTQNDGGTTYLGLARLDYIASPKHVFSFSTSNNESLLDLPGYSSPSPISPGLPTESSPFGRRPNGGQQTVGTFFSVSWRWTPTPRLTNEVRIGASLQRLDFLNSFRSQYGFMYAFVSDFADENPDGTVWSQPMAGLDPQGQSNRVYNYQDNLTYVVGRHSLQAGFSLQQYREWTYGIDTGNLSSVTVPRYELDSTGTVYSEGQAFGVTSPSSGYIPGAPPVSKPSSNLVSGYFQDNWRILPRLSINLGVRYDYLSPVEDHSGLAIIPTLTGGNAANEVYNQNLPFSFVPKNQGLYNSDRNNFAPYVGFAWQVADNVPLVVRGAYSISYVNDDLLRNMSTFAFQNGFQTFSYGYPYPSLGASGIPLSNVPAIPTPGFPSLTLPGLAQAYGGVAPPVNAVDPNLRTPYVQQANLGIDGQFKGFFWSVRYVGNRLEKGLLSVDRNQVTLSPQYLQFFSQNGAALTSAFGLQPQEAGEAAKQLQICGLLGTCNYSPGIYNFFGNPLAPNGINLLSNLGRSRYDSLQVSVSRRVSAGLSLTANYVFSKTLSNMDDYQQGAFDPNLDIHNPSLDEAPSPFDLRHAFKSTVIYDLPFGRNFASAGLARKIFGGWSISGIAIAQSGAPFSLLSTLGTFNTEADSGQNTVSTSLNASQIESHFGIIKSPDGTVSYVNAPAGSFQEPGPGQVGNLQRRMFSGPGAFNLNLGVRKVIAITERVRFEFRAESLNVLNKENWLVNDQVLIPGFVGNPLFVAGPVFTGGVQQWTPPRSIQFLARLRF